MEESTLIMKVDVATENIDAEILQELLMKVKKLQNSIECSPKQWDEISQVLLKHLQSGLDKFDDQLLCATCFYTVMNHGQKKKIFLNEILHIINTELDKRISPTNTSATTLSVSLIYGIFQSAFLTQNHGEVIEHIETLLLPMFSLLTSIAYEYSRYTFIAFKTMVSFKKVCGTELEKFIFNQENNLKLLNLINHNWENPITGVRDLNKSIFQILISVLDERIYSSVVEEVNNFYWNKAKYLMLSEIIELGRTDIIQLMQSNDWIEGLMSSLHKPGLVSAGADMYFAILKKLRSDNNWGPLFLEDISKILHGSSKKAIENFTNYWCLTTFKKFPHVAKELIIKMDSSNGTEDNLYSLLCILKQANKLGIVDKINIMDSTRQVIIKSVLNGKEHCNTHIRILAFELVCGSQAKNLPSWFEYNIILQFVHNNMNSDCTVLRLGMLGSLNFFLTQIQTAYNTTKQNVDKSTMQNLLDFSKELQKLVITCINLNGNYQRKITCIKVCRTLLTCFGKGAQRKRSQGVTKTTIIDILKDSDYWMLSDEIFILKLLELLKDPAEDVRENSVQLLLDQYSKDLKQTKLLNRLIDDALTCIKSKFFYEITCGQSMFKLISNVLLKEEGTVAKYKNVENIFSYALNELVSEYKIKRDIVISIEKGKQFYSFMNILQVILEICYKNSYCLQISRDDILELVAVLDGVSNQFVWEQESCMSSDFSKMSDMVESMIMEAGYNSAEGNDETKISGLHQLVLNCLWLNVKATCELSSLLIQIYKDDTEVCKKSLDIIAHVLETSRHKGAIEAAGAALGRGIQHLTALPDNSNNSKLPNILLETKLKEFMTVNEMTSITRRGAGLSIMVHRIVSSDLQKGKPLFHYFMRKIQEKCSTIEDIPNALQDKENIENEKDLPKAIYIHFLTRIVTDSSLASDMMFYSASLAEIAFVNLTSPHWQIRNAALQLYGALIPKLIGQKKSSGSGDDVIATVACDEFRTHSPKLWEFIEKQLRNANSGADKIQSHSNLVPILNMLANCARRYNFTYDMRDRKESDKLLLHSLILLLGSPIFTVRRLTAACIFNIYSFEDIFAIILNQDSNSENSLHGLLILTGKYYKLHKNKTSEFLHLKDKFNNILASGKHSYLSRELYDEIFYEVYSQEDKVNFIRRILAEVNKNPYVPGIFRWANMHIEKFIKNASWEEILKVLQEFLNFCNSELFCELLYSKIVEDVRSESFVKIANELLYFHGKYDTAAIWKILYVISKYVDIKSHETLTIIALLKDIGVTYKLRYTIPFTVRTLSNTNDSISLFLSQTVYNLSDTETSDVEMRYVAAIANNELANLFTVLPNEVKINGVKSAIKFLQDEDEDVRNISVEFYKNICGGTLQPYVCLHRIINMEFLSKVLPSSSIVSLKKELLMTSSTANNTSDTENCNPFANDSKNIYFEVEVLKQLVASLEI